MKDDDLVLGAKKAPAQPAPLPPADVDPKEEEALWDKVAASIFPICVQLTIQQGMAVGVNKQQLNWNIPVAAINALEAARIFVAHRRQVLTQFRVQQATGFQTVPPGKSN